jgi:hypothetical protein
LIKDSRGELTNKSFAVYVDTELSASVDGNVTVTEVGFPVQFTGSQSGGSAVYTNYSWQFGNGTPAAYGAGPKTHSFAAAGTYEVHYNVTDTLGYKSSGTTTVKVYPTLTASVSGNLSSSDVGLSVKFTETPSGGSGTYSTYTWTIGNGSTPATGSATLSHTFSAVGSVEVYCNVTDSLGHTASSHKLFSVAADPVGTPSHESRPGSLKCTCASRTPGKMCMPRASRWPWRKPMARYGRWEPSPTGPRRCAGWCGSRTCRTRWCSATASATSTSSSSR